MKKFGKEDKTLIEISENLKSSDNGCDRRFGLVKFRVLKYCDNRLDRRSLNLIEIITIWNIGGYHDMRDLKYFDEGLVFVEFRENLNLNYFDEGEDLEGVGVFLRKFGEWKYFFKNLHIFEIFHF